MRNRKSVRRDSPDAVDAAMAVLEELHVKGAQLKIQFPNYKRLPQPDESSTPWYVAAGFTNDDVVRKVRRFADPKRGYTQHELERLIRRCKKHGRALGFSFVAKLLSLPKKPDVRSRLESQLIRERWSTLRLNQELLSRFGRRRQGGKKRQVPADVAGMLAQFDQMALNWLRWSQRVREADSDQPARINALPKKIRDRVLQLSDTLEELRKLIGKAAADQRDT